MKKLRCGGALAVAVTSLVVLLLATLSDSRCCDSFLLSSRSIASMYQGDRLGVYTRTNDIVNDRPVYKQVEGDDFVYFWIFAEERLDDGANWIVSNDTRNWRHGIESPNLAYEVDDEGIECEGDHCGNRCITEINKSGWPFSVWTKLHRNHGWEKDTMLRAECYNPDIAANCCPTVRLRSDSVAGRFHADKLGVYNRLQDRGGRIIYKQMYGYQYLHYLDWGPNSGTNWVVTEDFEKNYRVIESQNMENFTDVNICVTDLHKVGPFKVWNTADRVWQTDWTLRVECYEEEINCCDKVAVVSTDTASSYHPEILDEYYFYSGRNGRSVYSSGSGHFYLYYHDWGSNQGSNWMVSRNFNQSDALLVSANVEHKSSICATDVFLKGWPAPFLVSTPFGWLEDRSLRIKCILFKDNNNTRLAEFLAFNADSPELRNQLIYSF